MQKNLSKGLGNKLTKTYNGFGIPNLLTVTRLIVSIPFYYYLWYREKYGLTAILIIGGFMILTDLFDGYLAKKLNQITYLGELLDPISDKIIIDLTALILCLKGDIPLIIYLPLVIRDVILGITAGLMVITGGRYLLPIITGKLTPFFWGIAMGFIVTGFNRTGIILAIIANIFAYASGYVYVLRGIQYLKSRRKI